MVRINVLDGTLRTARPNSAPGWNGGGNMPGCRGSLTQRPTRPVSFSSGISYNPSGVEARVAYRVLDTQGIGRSCAKVVRMVYWRFWLCLRGGAGVLWLTSRPGRPQPMTSPGPCREWSRSLRRPKNLRGPKRRPDAKHPGPRFFCFCLLFLFCCVHACIILIKWMHVTQLEPQMKEHTVVQYPLFLSFCFHVCFLFCVCFFILYMFSTLVKWKLRHYHLAIGNNQQWTKCGKTNSRMVGT